jgi:two-component system, LytTR family, sensor kinase
MATAVENIRQLFISYEMKKKLLVHLAVWIIYVVWIMLIAYYNNPTQFYFWNILLTYIELAGIFYAWVLLLLPLLLRHKSWLKFSLWLITIWLIDQCYTYFLDGYFNEYVYHTPPLKMKLSEFVISVSFYFIQYGILACGYYFIDDSNQKERQLSIKEKERHDAESAFLRAQINPHFLFNTLGALHEKAMEKAPELADGIAVLSDIMRYSIVQVGPDGKIPLEEEVQHIENLIAVHRLRHDDQLQVVFEQDTLPRHWRIVPHLLITLVENAFKHGELTNRAYPIHISISARDASQLICRVSNSVRKKATVKPGYVGLENLQKRLTAAYGDRFEMKVQNEGGIYTTTLHIVIT